jgi:hypothetical protein
MVTTCRSGAGIGAVNRIVQGMGEVDEHGRTPAKLRKKRSRVSVSKSPPIIHAGSGEGGKHTKPWGDHGRFITAKDQQALFSHIYDPKILDG